MNGTTREKAFGLSFIRRCLRAWIFGLWIKRGQMDHVALNRNDPLVSERVFKSFYPILNERESIARVLVHAIKTVHAVDENAWALTLGLREDFIRLNVGGTEVLVLTSSQIFAVFLRRLLPDAIHHEFGRNTEPIHYKSVPKPQSLCVIPAEAVERVFPLAVEAHDDFIREAVMRTQYSRSHSQGVVKFLRGFLNAEIPSPGYLPEEPTDDESELLERTAALVRRGRIERPSGSANPRAVSREVIVCERDPKVRAWVLQEARGICELCLKPAPFKLANGQEFLEVHHVKSLSDGGADDDENAVALCPNCHRALHYASDAFELNRKLHEQVARLPH